MENSLQELERRARMLSPQERAELAERLLESLRDAGPASVEAAWQQEIAARIAALERGDIAVHAAEDVFAEARLRLR